ncbi:hypothetical protein D3C71_1702680 [compost metagenome]
MSAASSRSSTCPRPKGTAAGNSSAIGHNANSTMAPLASATNQRPRKSLQRSMAPNRSSSAALKAPTKVPAVLSTRSRLDGTRRGR